MGVKSKNFKKIITEVVERLKFAGAERILFFGEGLENEEGEVEIVVCVDEVTEVLRTTVEELRKAYTVNILSLEECKRRTREIDLYDSRFAMYKRKGSE